MAEAMMENTPATEKRAPQKRFTQEELDAAIAKATEAAVAEALKRVQAAQPQTVVQVAKEEFVTILYLGIMAERTAVVMPKWGRITVPGGTLNIPKREFFQGLGVPVNNALLKRRAILVIDGLTDEERERFGLSYKEGEVLTQKAFFDLTTYPKDVVCGVFKKLCPQHRRLLADRYLYSYFEKGNTRVDLDTITELNQLSKNLDGEGMFTPILEDIGEKIGKM